MSNQRPFSEDIRESLNVMIADQKSSEVPTIKLFATMIGVVLMYIDALVRERKL